MSEIEGDLYVGEDAVVTFLVEASGGGPEDITGWTADFTLVNPESGAVEVTIAGVVVDAPGGEMSATIAATDTEELDAGDWPWFLARTNVGSQTVVDTGIIPLMDSPFYVAPP